MAVATMERLSAPAQQAFSPHSVLGQIGNTPLLKLKRLSAETPGVEIFAKDESKNPGGSVKDRPALNMILEGERTGALTCDKILLDATSGNTGIAYAMIGAARGFRVRLCVPQNASPERKRILKAYGADVIYTPGGEGSDGAIRKVREVYAENPDLYFYPNQYGNPANWQAHYKTTAPEILRQTEGRITHFIAAMGTSGTCMGVAKRFLQEAPHVRVMSLQPSSPFHGLEGLKHMPTAIVPDFYDPKLPHENIWAETEDAHRTVRRVGREEGLLVGISAGANIHAAYQLAKQLSARKERAVIVTLICDGAEKYLSEHFWDDAD